jgi:hypothetical protein
LLTFGGNDEVGFSLALWLAAVTSASANPIVTEAISGGPGDWIYSLPVTNTELEDINRFGITMPFPVITDPSPPGWVNQTFPGGLVDFCDSTCSFIVDDSYAIAPGA